MLKPTLLAILVATLAGCGAHTQAVLPAAMSFAGASRVATADVAVAEKAIRTSIEKHIADYHVSLQTLLVQRPSAGAVYAFTADEAVSGLGGARHFHLTGTYDGRANQVKVSARTPMLETK